MLQDPCVLIAGDNLSHLPEIPTGSVDAVVGDPPYDAGLEPEIAPWDTFPPLECWQEIYRVLKLDGLLAFDIDPNRAHLRVPAVVECGFEVVEVGFWVWGNGRPRGADRLKRCYDLVYFMRKAGTTHGLFTDQARGEHRTSPRSAIGPGALGRHLRRGPRGPYEYGRHYYPADVATTSDSTALPRNYQTIFAVRKVWGKARTKKWHPTEKPLDLMAQIVRLVSRPGDLVLDPWVGRGTTGVAALALGRRFLGIDIDAWYVQMARERLRAVQLEMEHTHSTQEVQQGE